MRTPTMIATAAEIEIALKNGPNWRAGTKRYPASDAAPMAA
jgi:hypothetical protein